MVKRIRKPTEKTYEAELAQDRVEVWGLKTAEKPSTEIPHLPDDVTEVDDSTLMSMLRDVTQWLNYLEVRLGVTSTEAETAEKHYRRVEAVYVTRSNESQVTKAKMEASLESEVLDAQDDYDVKNATRRMVRVIYDNLARDANYLSREITRRVGREPLDRRTHKYGGG